MSANPAAAPTARHSDLMARSLRPSTFAVHDWLVLSYVLGLAVATALGVRSPSYGIDIARLLGFFGFALMGVYLARCGLFRESALKGVLYRLAVYGPVQLSYFLFRELLPKINPSALDQQLSELDLKWFGVEPAMALERFISPFTTEWFAFFYFGYFFVLAVHVVPILFFSRNQRLLGEFGLGMLMVFCIGHTVYMLVPGFGPYRAMASSFHTQFPHGLWLDLVMDTVRSGGAQKDIFPSLHTAAPAFIALFSFHHRARVPYRYTWPITAFFSANIMVATMFLRWHYLIDVFAGLVLATATAVAAPQIVEWELKRRERKTASFLWPLLLLPDALDDEPERPQSAARSEPGHPSL